MMIQPRRLVFILLLVCKVTALSLSSSSTRRHVLQTAAASTVAISLGLPALAQEEGVVVDTTVHTDPSRLVLSNGVSIPRVGYSLYKTAAEQVPDGIQLALAAGIRHFDTASQYGTNSIVGKTLQQYLQSGLDNGKEEVGADLAAIAAATTASKRRARRREQLFVTHKLSNEEQSIDPQAVRKAVKQQIKLLGVTYLDMVMIHSPLTDKARRLATYRALIDLQTKGLVRAVGVCHFGVAPLQELVDAGLPAPSVIQLVLSPFHPHADVAKWAFDHGSILECAAWSKLSSVTGPADGWAALGKLAAARGMTKQQVLIRWAVQKGYLCIPRSGSKFKAERQAIEENSWAATTPFVLTAKEMALLDALDEQLPAGQLEVVDGWSKADIVDAKWDPTTAIV